MARTQFGAALRQLLTERAISGNRLGERVGVSGTTISYWINGRTQPTRENVERLEVELKVEPRGWLLDLAGYSSTTDDAPTVESLLRADPGIDPEDKRALLRLLATARDRFARRDLPPAVRLEGELRGLRDDLKDRTRRL